MEQKHGKGFRLVFEIHLLQSRGEPMLPDNNNTFFFGSFETFRVRVTDDVGQGVCRKLVKDVS